jgi:cytochrome b involved in lipid metabolism
MVLDVSKYMDNHPGGKFSLQHNIGRDVCKFFYGGYSLENTNEMKPWVHTNNARKALNTLIMATFKQETPTRPMIVESTNTANESGSIRTISFK